MRKKSTSRLSKTLFSRSPRGQLAPPPPAPAPPPPPRVAARVPGITNILSLSCGPAATAIVIDASKSLRDQYVNRFVLAEKSYLRSLHVILVCYMTPMNHSQEGEEEEGADNRVPLISSDDLNLVSVIRYPFSVICYHPLSVIRY